MARWNLIDFPVPTQFLKVPPTWAKIEYSRVLFRFLINIDFHETGCWIWCGSKVSASSPDAYGQIKCRGKNILTHRLALILAGVDLPEDKLSLHKCDVPLCVCPDHLFVGTHLDNILDRNAKGRANARNLRGEEHPQAILNESIVLAIRREYLMNPRMNITEKALSVGVTPATLCDAIRCRTWKHI